ncbi:MAG: FxLYD domain-containing protein [Dehalococcoidales bacterium]|nr:FxLYD domain-containing protein [Dehalococcoidales bacterium]NLT27600.1 hypothetical protein [Dehalococcoidales bacterium]
MTSESSGRQYDSGCGCSDAISGGHKIKKVTFEKDVPENNIEETDGPVILPEPMVYGNDKISIIKHKLEEMQVYNVIYKISVDFAIKNISDQTIATLVFEIKFYDEKGKVIDTVLHKETAFRPGTSRGICVPTNETVTPGIIKSYEARITRMTTTETEKVQLRSQTLNDLPTGETELSGSLKNISASKTDAALLVTFATHLDEFIGDKVLIVRNIEPDQVKNFSLKYTPHSNAAIEKYTIRIVSDLSEMIEEIK